MADVAEAAGVAARTLQCGFRRYRNYTAEQFLRDERLAVARTALMNGRERNRSVADIAFEYGFSHLGRFASAYQRRFGEKPSETLRKGS
jgi:transcriptional regulator GlxA family with amidase domain